MPAYLRATNGAGGCCACSQQVGCNCGSFPLQCRSASGTASLCGFSEFATPSNPPKKYRRVDLSGTIKLTGLAAGGFPCGIFPSGAGGYSWVLAGGCTYHVATCELTTSGTLTTGPGLCNNCSHGRPNGTSAVCDVNPPADMGLPSILSVTKTSKVFTPVDCWSGSGSLVLSVEDTEEDAAGRAAGNPTTWVVAPTCAGLSSFALTRAPATFEFAFRKVQVRARVDGLVVGQTYDLKFRFGEKPVGAPGEFLDLGANETISVTVEEGDVWTPWVDFPTVAGMEYVCLGCEIVV